MILGELPYELILLIIEFAVATPEDWTSLNFTSHDFYDLLSGVRQFMTEKSVWCRVAAAAALRASKEVEDTDSEFCREFGEQNTRVIFQNRGFGRGRYRREFKSDFRRPEFRRLLSMLRFERDLFRAVAVCGNREHTLPGYVVGFIGPLALLCAFHSFWIGYIHLNSVWLIIGTLAPLLAKSAMLLWVEWQIRSNAFRIAAFDELVREDPRAKLRMRSRAFFRISRVCLLIIIALLALAWLFREGGTPPWKRILCLGVLEMASVAYFPFRFYADRAWCLLLGIGVLWMLYCCLLEFVVDRGWGLFVTELLFCGGQFIVAACIFEDDTLGQIFVGWGSLTGLLTTMMTYEGYSSIVIGFPLLSTLLFYILAFLVVDLYSSRRRVRRDLAEFLRVFGAIVPIMLGRGYLKS